MNILMIADNDPAGMGIAFTHAVNRFSGHTCRLITRIVLYNFDFEKDLHIPDISGDAFDEVRDLLDQADVFHFHTLVDENSSLGPLRIRDYMRGKALIHHHHGHPEFRSHSERFREKYKRLNRKAIVSTPDLLHLLPEASWLPNVVPIHAPLLTPNPQPENGRVRVCQSPTRKDLKNTQEFLAAVVDLQTAFPALECNLIEMMPHRQCLIEKNACHIVFDHMQGYYGVSSLESLSQGKPVIAGLDEWNQRHIKNFFGTENLPWISATNAYELKRALKTLIPAPDLRKEKGEQSRAFMETFWNEETVVGELIKHYERLWS